MTRADINRCGRLCLWSRHSQAKVRWPLLTSLAIMKHLPHTSVTHSTLVNVPKTKLKSMIQTRINKLQG